MPRPRHFSLTAAVVVCLVSTQSTITLFASDDVSSKTQTSPAPATPDRARFTLPPGFFATNQPAVPSVSVRQIYPGRPYPMPPHRHDGAIVALTIGAIATITGTAILIYANRPECDFNHHAGGCGYGTNVVGGSVLAGGIVGLTVGAITW
jgi:hypothetical protein